jgi:zinc protease
MICLAQSRRVLGALACAAILVAPLAAQVTTPPTLAPPPTLVLPAVERAVLPNGLTILVARNAEVPIVEEQLVIDGGARLPNTPSGVASLTATLLTEGAGNRDALKFAEAIDFLGGRIGAFAGWEDVTLSLRSPRRNIDSAMALMADVALRPTFLGTDVKRERDLRLTALERAKDRPGAVASRVFSRNLFPAAHPYHIDLAGDSSAVVTIDSVAIRHYWQRASDPRRATLIVTGDVTLAEATAWAEKYFGHWTSPAGSPAKPPARAIAAAPRPVTHVILVDKPGAAQSVIIIGAPGVERSSPDYPAIMLMNTILGGSFSARLNDFLREKLGYSYGAGSSYAWRPVPGPFTAQASVRTNVTDSSLIVFFREMKRMRDEPVSAVELTRGKNYIVLGALSNYETAGDLNVAIGTSLMFDRPLGAITAEHAAIQQLTTADVQRAAQQYLDAGRMTVVVVGDLAKIRASIENLNLGPVEVQVY